MSIKIRILKYFFLLFCVVFTSSTFAQFLTVVDAGSSGSRVHVYKISDGKVTEITSPDTKKISPGLSQVSADQASVRAFADSIEMNIKKSTNNGEQISPANMDVDVYATAGMRLVNPVVANVVYAELEKDLLADGYAKVSAKTIPGKMEGAYDWVALNYLKGAFSGANGQTYGVLDMGGASTEIAYQVKQNDLVPQSDRVDFKIGDKQYHLYSRSYLGLGQDLARSQFSNVKSCFPNGYVLPNGEKATGNYGECAHDFDSLVNGVHHVSQSNIAVDQPFYLISGFYYAATSNAFGFKSGQIALAQLSNQGNLFCHTSWETLEAQNPDDHYLYSYCVSSAYFDSLLEHGYHFSADKKFDLASKINNTSIDWALGVAVSQVDSLGKK